MNRTCTIAVAATALATLAPAGEPPSRSTPSGEPPNPFAPAEETRPDSVRALIVLSDGRRLVGRTWLTRDHRLRIRDEQQARVREVPLRAVARVSAEVARQWMEREWRFKENADDEKVFTGRAYPARIYRHTVTLKARPGEERPHTISGPLAAVVYVEPEGASDREPPRRFILHKRHKGQVGEGFDDLVYVERIVVEPGEADLRDAPAPR